jgi:hypothetical protein
MLYINKLDNSKSPPSFLHVKESQSHLIYSSEREIDLYNSFAFYSHTLSLPKKNKDNFVDHASQREGSDGRSV